MRHNGMPPILASSLSPNLLDLTPGRRPMAACPDCAHWGSLHRGMLWPHPSGHGTDRVRCPGSGHRFVVDVTSAEWLWALELGDRHAGTRRSAPTYGVTGQPPVPVPACRPAAAS